MTLTRVSAISQQPADPGLTSTIKAVGYGSKKTTGQFVIFVIKQEIITSEKFTALGSVIANRRLSVISYYSLCQYFCIGMEVVTEVFSLVRFNGTVITKKVILVSRMFTDSCSCLVSESQD